MFKKEWDIKEQQCRLSLITHDSTENAEYHSIGNSQRFKPANIRDMIHFSLGIHGPLYLCGFELLKM